ncbi:MAG: hypothetical protein O2820_23625 [Planctomycetota bacterium]|nr:hypothetical protein [Planctomycetota bacterium]MDA1252206.1 hypothetical protein [Planctomycetota bacterium]
MHSQISDRRALAVSVVWASCVMGSLLAFVPAAWDDSDDVRMSMIAAGIGSPNGPSSFLVYMNVAVGAVLSLLYERMPDVVWYTWMHIAAHIVSFSVVGFVVIVMGVRKSAAAALAMLQVALASYFWTHLQFTTTAAMLAISGVSLFALGLSRPPEKNRARFFWCGGLLLTASSLVRLQSLQLVVLLSAVCLVALVWEFRARVRVLRDGLPVAVTIAVILGAFVANDRAYQSELELAQFRKVLTTYAPVVNSVYVKQLLEEEGKSPFVAVHERRTEESQLKLLGLTWNDLSCMMWLFMIDEDVYSLEQFVKLKLFFQRLPRPRVFFLMMVVVLPGILLRSNFYLLLFGVSIGLLLRVRLSRLQVAACCLTWAAALGVMVVLLATLKLPDRVFIPAGIVCCVATLVSCYLRRDVGSDGPSEAEPEENSDRPFAKVWLGLMACFGVFVSWQHVASSVETLRVRRIVDATIEKLTDREDSLQVLLVPFPFAYLDPMQNQRNLDDWRFVYLDGHQRSPRQKSIIREHLNQPLSEAILNHPKVRLFFEPQSRNMPIIREFYRTHYGLDVRFPIDERLPWGTVRRVVSRPLKTEPDLKTEPAAAVQPDQAAAVDVSGSGS